jgi:hypothetical protein
MRDKVLEKAHRLQPFLALVQVFEKATNRIWVVSGEG